MNIQETIGSIVAEDYRTAPVFSKFHIDFCCKGGRTIEEVCSLKGIGPETLIAALEEAKKSASLPEDGDVKSWSATKLADYIEKVHHGYVRDTMPVLGAYLKKVATVHGDRHPELKEIFALYSECTVELLNHMIKEETVLFPSIRKMDRMVENGKLMTEPFFFGTVQNPISMMREEHITEGDRFEKIATLSNNYNVPDDACNTYRVAFAKLKEFQEDLHRHIHLENNILFHKAVELERKMLLQDPNEYSACSCSVANH